MSTNKYHNFIKCNFNLNIFRVVILIFVLPSEQLRKENNNKYFLLVWISIVTYGPYLAKEALECPTWSYFVCREEETSMTICNLLKLVWTMDQAFITNYISEKKKKVNDDGLWLIDTMGRKSCYKNDLLLWRLLLFFTCWKGWKVPCNVFPYL